MEYAWLKTIREDNPETQTFILGYTCKYYDDQVQQFGAVNAISFLTILIRQECRFTPISGSGTERIVQYANAIAYLTKFYVQNKVFLIPPKKV
jgi:hypothetical protein